jgi:hypothetical protein
MLCVAALAPANAQTFQLSYPASASAGPITGRAFLFVARTNKEEPRLQSGPDRESEPFFGVDVDALAPGKVVTIDPNVPGFPVASLAKLPAGDYYVEGLLLPYTRFKRSDGHTIWVHMDQWEGSASAAHPAARERSPEGAQARAQDRGRVASLTKTIPAVSAAQETEWVKRLDHVEARERVLGSPMTLGAVVLLPKGYAENTTKRYPVVYTVGHYSERAAGIHVRGVRQAGDAGSARGALRNESEPGVNSASWVSGKVPEVIAVFIQHTTPYYDDSYVLNSANNGPYGDAITQELIPEIDKRFRTIAAPYARVLTGGSTGGWDVLALQIHYLTCSAARGAFPDQLDFRTTSSATSTRTRTRTCRSMARGCRARSRRAGRRKA